MSKPAGKDHFKYGHLPPHLQTVSSQFAHVADYVRTNLPDGEQRQLCLTHLLQAKDAAVRAKLEEKED